jgi:hypothetical protein
VELNLSRAFNNFRIFATAQMPILKAANATPAVTPYHHPSSGRPRLNPTRGCINGTAHSLAHYWTENTWKEDGMW